MNEIEPIELIKIQINEPNEQDLESFEKNGFLILNNIIPNEKDVEKLAERALGCFHYKGDRGTTPDETTWRPNLSRDDIPRGFANSWKTDSVMSQLILNGEIGKIASKMLKCDSVRVAHDDIFYKPPKTKPIGMHQDQPYLNCFTPKDVVTVWIALSDVSKENGTLEFVIGSHKWKELEAHELAAANESSEFFAPDDYLKSLGPVMKKQGLSSIKDSDLHYVTVKKGSASIHHGKLWHGSKGNSSSTNDRIGITIHLVPSDCTFDPNVKPVNSFGRYKLFGSNAMDETFYPITYSKNGYKSPIVDYMMNNRYN